MSWVDHQVAPRKGHLVYQYALAGQCTITGLGMCRPLGGLGNLFSI